MSPSKTKRLTHWLRHTAVYWGSPVSDGEGGRTFDNPVELAVRWEERHDLFMDAQGQEQQSSAVVFVAQDVVVGGYLFLGDLDDLSSAEEGDPLNVDGAYEIRQFDKIPDLKATSFLRRAWL